MPFPFPFSAFKTPRAHSLQSLTYASDGDSNGLFYFIGTQYGATGWVNPQGLSTHQLIATASGILGGAEEGLDALSDRAAGHFYTTNVPNSWVKFDVGVGCHLILNAYSYRTRSGFNGDHPTAWKIEGSNDNSTWTLIDTQTVSFSTTDEWLTTAVVGQTVGYRFFRWTQTAPNSPDSHDYFVFGEAELYGDFRYLP